MDPRKKEYILKAEVGKQLVAFRDSNGKLSTAKVVKIDPDDEMLFLEDIKGKGYHVPFESVLWVKTEGKSWPGPIFRELKGVISEKEKGCSSNY